MNDELRQGPVETEMEGAGETVDAAVAMPVEGSGGADTVVGQATRVINPPPAGQMETVRLAPGERFELAANPATVSLVVEGNNLLLGFDLDGNGTPDSFVILEDLIALAAGGNPPVLMVAGEAISVDLLVGNAVALGQADQGGPGVALETAAGGGGAQGSGASAYSDNLGDAIDLLVAQGVIPPVQLEFGVPELDDRITILLEENDPPLADPVLTPASLAADGGEGSGLPEALQEALYDLSGAVSVSDLESFAGLPGGALSGFGLTEGSAMKITFAAEAGDNISFDWNFLTNEGTPGDPYNDTSIVVILIDGIPFTAVPLADTHAAFSDSGSAFNEETGYTTVASNLPVSGTYTFVFIVGDVGDKLVDSGLLVDNFQLNGSTEGFESATFTGWEVIGDSQVVSALFGVAPTEGASHGLITTGEGQASLDSIVFFKQLVVSGEIGDDDSGVVADFGGADSETPLENLVFTLQGNPTFGQLILVTAGGDTSFLTPGDTFSSGDTVWWIATEEQIADFLAQPGAPEFLPNVEFPYSVTDEDGASANAPVVITLPPPTVPRASLGVFQGDCLSEDTEGKLLFAAYPTDGASKISQIVISGFPTGGVADAWVVEPASVDIFGYTLGVDYTTSFDAATGELTITFITASFSVGEGVQGTVDVTPNPDSDVDRKLTIEATAINGAGSATDVEDSVIVVDAIADGAEGGVGDDGDLAHLSVVVSVTDSEGEVPENGTFQAGEIGTLTVHATFDDFLDGSETHALFIKAPVGFEILGLIGDLPEGVTLLASGPDFMTFDVETLNGIGVVDLSFQVQNVSAEEGDATFYARATAVETSTPDLIPGDMECDGGEGGNFAAVIDDAIATVATVAPPEVSISLYGGEDCIEEDSTDNQVDISVIPAGDDLLTEIVISGLQADWSYDFSGLGGAGITVDDSVPGQVTITFETPSNAPYNASFLVTPPSDSDVDHPPLLVSASVEDPKDPSLTADGDDMLHIHVDANADAGPGAIGGTDDGDGDYLSIAIDSISDAGGNGSFQAGESGTVTVTATFDDYLDGSEIHEFSVVAPAGFTIDGIAAPNTLPNGVTFDLAGDGSSITFFLPTDPVDGLASLTVTLNITNESAGEGEHTFEVWAKAVETQTGDEECDDSDDDNVALVSAEQSVTVAAIVAPTVSINLQGDVTYIKEDSEDNVIEFSASAGDLSDELTTVVITFPPEVGLEDINFSAVAAHEDVANVDIDDNGGAGPVVVTITFDSGTNSFSGTFLLNAPVQDSDVDLGEISIVANVQDQVDHSLTDTANGTLQIDVDAVLDTALDPGVDSVVNVTEIAGSQTINLGLSAALISAGFALSGAGGDDTDNSESFTVVLVLDNPLPSGVTLSSTDGTVTQDLVADPTGATYVIAGVDLKAAIDGLQVELPASFEGTISGKVTVTSIEANTPAGEVPASGAEPDEEDNLVVLSASFTVKVADGAAPRGGELSLTVDEAALDEDQDGDDLAPGTTFGNNAGSPAETAAGSLIINAGADPIVDIAFGSTEGIVVEDEAGNPINVQWSGSGTDSLTGTLNGVVVLVLSLSGDNTAIAGGSANVTVTATLTDAFPHYFSHSGDVTITGIVVDAEDDDGDVATSLVDVTVLDDEPHDISPEATVLGSGTGSTFTGDLDFYDNVGADKPGDVVFDSSLQGTALLAADGVTPVTSNGEAIILDISNGGHTLTGYVESGDNVGYQEEEDAKVFTVVLNPDSANEADDEYTITLFDEIDTGGGLLFDNFGDVNAGGPKEFIALDDPRTGLEDLGEDILITASPESGLVNASTQGVGVANQQVDAGETIRVDFVSNVVGLTDDSPGIKDNFVNLTYSGHRTAPDGSGFNISQDFGPTTVRVKAFDADDDKDFGGDPDDIQLNITLVTVISAAGVVLLDNVSVDASNGGVSVTFNDDGTVTVTGLLKNYQVLVGTGEGFEALEITAVGSKFDLGGIVTTSAQAGDPIHLDFGLVATDEDGDASSGAIQVTVLPQVNGSDGADILMAGANGSNIQAGSGNDTLLGGIANDLLQGEGGDDTISDGEGNDTIIGGTGADIVNLVDDGDTDILEYNDIGEAGDIVNGFSTAAPNPGGAGGDIIDLVDLLDGGSFTGTTLAEAQAGGYVELLQTGSDVEVRVDLDGGGNGYTTIVTISNVNVADLSDNIVVD